MGAVDRFQRRHKVIAIPLAVLYKFVDDQGNYLAATLTYYAFVAIFPLMLIGTSILGIVLGARPEWQQDILDSALGQFPIIGDELGRPQGLQGSFVGVTVGALAALYGSMGLGQALQNVQHVAWSVPRNSRPNPFYSRVKTLLLLVLSGLSLLAVTIVSTIFSQTDVLGAFGGGFRLLTQVATALVVGTGLTLLFRFAATGQHSFRRAAPGGYALAVMWQLLQVIGAAYVSQVLVGTTSMTKTFGLVLGLMGFIFIGSLMAVWATEINVVLARRLYPRALLTPFTDSVELTHADRRAYASYARAQRHKGFEQVAVHFEAGPDTDRDPGADTGPDTDPDTDPDPGPGPGPTPAARGTAGSAGSAEADQTGAG